MDTGEFPTKGNLMKAKSTLAMSKMGYDLIDKKRNVLIREIMELNNKAAEIQKLMHKTFHEAYMALQEANITMGLHNVRTLSFGMPLEETVTVRIRSIMGVEIPEVRCSKDDMIPNYGFMNTTSALDEAVLKFRIVKELTVKLCTIETTAFRLATSIKKTQRRANALKYLTIPRYEQLTKNIASTLEERERDEFTRLKVIKNTK